VDNRVARAGRPVSDFFTGVGLLGRGLGSYARSPGLLLLGMLPALLTFILLVAGFVAVLAFLGPESRAVTWFAEHWPSGARDLVRALAQIAIVGVYVLVSIVAFTGLTLAIGDPFYEKISERVENRYGGLPGAVDRPWWKELGRGILESIRLVTLSIVIGVMLFLAGLLPAVGQTVVPVIGALVGGWALAVELTGVAFARPGTAAARPAAGTAPAPVADPRLRRRGVRLLPDPARRGAADAGRGRGRDAADPSGAGAAHLSVAALAWISSVRRREARMTQGMPGSNLDLELLAAQLRRHTDDLSLYSGMLLNVLSATLPPELVRVRREGRLKARLAGREPAVLGVSVTVGDHRYELDRAAVGAPAVTRICHESGGVVMSTKQVGADEWSRSLAGALARAAGGNASAAAALQRLTEP
jgi:CysZ protein